MLSRLQEALRTFRGDEIWVRSPGGNAEAAMQAGRVIRDRGLATRIPPGWACFRSCTYLFLGGVSRAVEGDGLLMVSMFSFTDDPEVRRRAANTASDPDALLTDIARASAMRATEDNDFLLRMGVSRRFLTEIVYRQHAVGTARDPSTRRCLTLAEARRYNLVNGRPSAPATPESPK
jgi:hypothetical protein